ncbi:MAG: hypothetical protein FJX06_18200 [Alphaproteobacteria bacterium]|nr:hypothetical protein [Alphaproteobacteria bacterium]
MTTLSIQQLEKYLKAYSLDLEYWANDMGDTDETLGSRELLEERRSELTPVMLEKLISLDNKAKQLLDDYQGPDTWDVKMLRKIVELGSRSYRQAA